MVINTGTGSDQVFIGGQAREINLNFPKRDRTEYVTINGFEGEGETEIAFGLNVDLTSPLDRVVPVDIEDPAVNLLQPIPASRGLSQIRTPVLLQDADGLIDTIVYEGNYGAGTDPGVTSLILDDHELTDKRITTDSTRVIFPVASSASGQLTDLVAQLSSLSASDRAAAEELINDYLQNQIVFTDRYYDLQLIDRIFGLAAGVTETVTIAADVSYAVFQDKLNPSGDIITARMQLDAFLAGTGYTANYLTSPHPDSSRTGNWVFYFDASLGDLSDIVLTGDNAFDGDAVISSTATQGTLPGADPQTDPGVNEVQSLANPRATAGSFTLTVNGLTTAALAFDADYQDVEDALNAILGAGSVKVTDTDLLYELDSITNAAGEQLAFEAQNQEIIVDGVATPDLIGVSLVTAEAYDLELQAGYITAAPVDDQADRTRWHSLHEFGEAPMVYDETEPVFEEIRINFNQAAATTLIVNTDGYQGKTFVEGGTQADHFVVHAIAGQTFINGGAGDDVFDIGQGTVERIASGLFLQGGTGTDSVFVYNENSIDPSNAVLEKQTVQHNLTRVKLSRITNALEFTNVTPDENAAIAAALEAASVEYAQFAALAEARQLQTVAIQAGNEAGASIYSALADADADFDQAIVDLTLGQQDNLRTFIKDGLENYYEIRTEKDAKQGEYNGLVAERDAAEDKINELIKNIGNSVKSAYKSFLGIIEVTISLNTKITIPMILNGYNAGTNKVTLTVSLKKITRVFGIPFTENKTETLTFVASKEEKSAILTVRGFEARSKALQQDIKTLEQRQIGAEELLKPYFSAGQLNSEFYAIARQTGDWVTPADALIAKPGGKAKARAS